VLSISFVCRPGTCDDEFHRLDAATQAVAQATTHRAAKAEYDRWYNGYRVVVAEVRGASGDGRLPHLTSPITRIRRPRGVENS